MKTWNTFAKTRYYNFLRHLGLSDLILGFYSILVHIYNICSLEPTYPLLCFGRSVFRINKYGSFSESDKSPVFHSSHLKVSNCNTVVSKERKKNSIKTSFHDVGDDVLGRHFGTLFWNEIIIFWDENSS